MNTTKGTFKCPKCGKGVIEGFHCWICRDEYINNNLKKKYVFSEGKEKRWEYCLCCCCCGKDWDNRNVGRYIFCCCQSEKDFKEDKCALFCCYPFIVLIYILSFFWVDLINFLCCADETYLGAEGRHQKETVKEKELFSDCVGITEYEWNDKFSKWECDNCKYQASTFHPFMSSSQQNTNTNQLMRQSTRNYAALQFISTDQTISFSMPCKNTDSFEYAESVFYEQYPDLKNKNCTFLVNGFMVDKTKNIEENKIKTGDKIIVIPNENVSTIED